MIRTYVDALGRTQRAVDGPHGTYLITQESPSSPYQVCKSDSLRINSQHRTTLPTPSRPPQRTAGVLMAARGRRQARRRQRPGRDGLVNSDQ